MDVDVPRGGDIFSLSSIRALAMKDLAIKRGLVSLVGTPIWSDIAVEQILKYSSAIVAAPGGKLTRGIQKLRGIDDRHTHDIKTILLDQDITNQEKVELV